MSEPVLSLAEVAELERAYALGAPALGRAAAALLARWRLPLRDDETFLRLAFLSWYRDHEPDRLTGLGAELPAVHTLVADRGGEGALTPEARFTLAILWDLFPPLGGDEAVYRERSRAWAGLASAAEPASALFREWPYLLGEAADTASPRIYIERELHARYAGRGAVGTYLLHTLGQRLRPGGPSRGAA